MCILHIFVPGHTILSLRAICTYQAIAMKPYDTDVLICGAGAAGLTLAIDLARRGVDFRLVEKRETPFHGSRGKGIQPRTLELFEDLGLLDRILAAGGPYPAQRIYRTDGGHDDSPIAAPSHAAPAEPYAVPWMVPQFLTERVMRERLAELGHRPAFAHELIDLQQNAEGVIATIAGPDGPYTLHARYLVGADGGRSFVRQALGIGFPGRTLGMRGLVADVSLAGLGREAWHRFGGSAMEHQLGLCPLAGTELFQLQAAVPPEGAIDTSVAGIGALVAARTGRDDIRITAVSWASVFHMNARLADRYRDGRVLLAGDAAHTHPPTGGQGLNTSVQDAYNLGWKLAAVLAGAAEALLDSYEEERRPIARDVLGLSTRLLDAARQGDMRRGRETRQLDLGYHDSPLTLPSPARPQGLRAGDRTPDAPLQRATGTPTRVFALLQGPHWTLLCNGIAHDALPPHPQLHVHAIGAGGDLRDAHGHWHDAYGLAPGEAVLVRPDGYVAAILAADRLGALPGYLRRVGIELQAQP
jgi:2-polyprenyl-6-methoxyphenol hydroxylase-like FAD-dependent oxidoreductase